MSEIRNGMANEHTDEGGLYCKVERSLHPVETTTASTQYSGVLRIKKGVSYMYKLQHTAELEVIKLVSRAEKIKKYRVAAHPPPKTNPPHTV